MQGLLITGLISDNCNGNIFYYQSEEQIVELIKFWIWTIITNPAFELVQCSMIATKAVNYAVERIEALETMNYVKTKDRLLAADGESYGDYWVITQGQ